MQCPELYPARLLCLWDFSRQKYWSRLSSPSPGNLPDLEIEPASPELAGGFFTSEPPRKPSYVNRCDNSWWLQLVCIFVLSWRQTFVEIKSGIQILNHNRKQRKHSFNQQFLILGVSIFLHILKNYWRPIRDFVLWVTYVDTYYSDKWKLNNF